MGHEFTLTVSSPPDVNVVATIGVPGAEGPTGPAGPAGGSLTHVQSVASTVWTVPHTLGHNPNVAVAVAGVDVMADVEWVTTTRVDIRFTTPTVGEAYLS